MSEIEYILNEHGGRVGFVCPNCGAQHKWTAYVYAHTHITLYFSCYCNARYSVLNEIVETMESKKVDKMLVTIELDKGRIPVESAIAKNMAAMNYAIDHCHVMYLAPLSDNREILKKVFDEYYRLESGGEPEATIAMTKLNRALQIIAGNPSEEAINDYRRDPIVHALVATIRQANSTLEKDREIWKNTAQTEKKRADDLQAELATRPTVWAYEQACAALHKHEAENKRRHETHRWNIEEIDGGLRICRGNHENAAPCQYEYFVPKKE